MNKQLAPVAPVVEPTADEIRLSMWLRLGAANVAIWDVLGLIQDHLGPDEQTSDMLLTMSTTLNQLQRKYGNV